MRLKKWICSPWMLLLLAAGLLLSIADYRTYGQEGLVMTAVESAAASRSVTVEILNETDGRFWNYGNYGQEHRLQRRLLGLWFPMRREKRPDDTVCAALPVFYYEKGVPQRFSFRWADNSRFPFMALEPGRYRLILDFYKDGGEAPAAALAAEFNVP